MLKTPILGQKAHRKPQLCATSALVVYTPLNFYFFFFVFVPRGAGDDFIIDNKTDDVINVRTQTINKKSTRYGN